MPHASPWQPQPNVKAVFTFLRQSHKEVSTEAENELVYTERYTEDAVCFLSSFDVNVEVNAEDRKWWVLDALYDMR